MEGLEVQGISAQEAVRLGYEWSKDLKACIRGSIRRLPMPASRFDGPAGEVEVARTARSASLKAIRASLLRDREFIDGIMAEALLALIRRAGREPLPCEEVRLYLFGTVRRIAWNSGLERVQELGARVRFGAEDADGEAVAISSVRPDRLVEFKEELDALRADLSADEQLILQAWMEDRFQDAVQALGISETAARKRISALLDRLALKMGVVRTHKLGPKS